MGNVPTIEPKDLKELLVSSKESILLLDVRQPEEHQLVSLPSSHLIPLMDLPSRFEEIWSLSDEGKKPVIVYCRVGGRSEIAAEFLLSSGLENVRNLRGGINAYAFEADSSMTSY